MGLSMLARFFRPNSYFSFYEHSTMYIMLTRRFCKKLKLELFTALGFSLDTVMQAASGLS